MDNSELIEHLTEYYSGKGSKNFNVLDFVGAFGSPLLAVAYSKLFWPDFSEFEDMIFLSDHLEMAYVKSEQPQQIKECLAESWEKQRIEYSFNLCDVPESFFNKNAGDTYDSEDEYLANVLAQMWKSKLTHQFPSRNFNVEVLTPEENGGEFAVTFYQLMHEKF